jgi:hypothetical protein
MEAKGNCAVKRNAHTSLITNESTEWLGCHAITPAGQICYGSLVHVTQSLTSFIIKTTKLHGIHFL